MDINRSCGHFQTIWSEIYIVPINSSVITFTYLIERLYLSTLIWRFLYSTASLRLSMQHCMHLTSDTISIFFTFLLIRDRTAWCFMKLLSDVSSGHVARVIKKRNAYRIMVWKREGKRPLERPSCRWEHSIRVHLSEV
jgi:hypothetical protein